MELQHLSRQAFVPDTSSKWNMRGSVETGVAEKAVDQFLLQSRRIGRDIALANGMMAPLGITEPSNARKMPQCDPDGSERVVDGFQPETAMVRGTVDVFFQVTDESLGRR